MSVNNLTEVFPGKRGVGKTFKQVAKIPDGGIIFVLPRMTRHIEDILCTQGRSHNCIRILEIGSMRDCEEIRGLRGTPYAFDHSFLEQMSGKIGNFIEAYMDD